MLIAFDLPGFTPSLEHTSDGELTYRLSSAQSAFAAGAMLLRTATFKPSVRAIRDGR
jgi:hypothetical protein